MTDNEIRFYSKRSNPKYYWLSPFYECKFLVDAFGDHALKFGDKTIVWYSIEHYMQAMRFITCKGAEPEEFQDIVDDIIHAETPMDARIMGRDAGRTMSGPEEAYWKNIRYDVMEAGQFAKFRCNESLRDKLFATGDSRLVYDSHDMYWGRTNRGLNKLGEILEHVRDVLRREYTEKSLENKRKQRRRRRKRKKLKQVPEPTEPISHPGIPSNLDETSCSDDELSE